MSADLAEAERWARNLVDSEFQPPGPGLDKMRALLAEYDRRGAAIERVRELLESAQDDDALLRAAADALDLLSEVQP